MLLAIRNKKTISSIVLIHINRPKKISFKIKKTIYWFLKINFLMIFTF